MSLRKSMSQPSPLRQSLQLVERMGGLNGREHKHRSHSDNADQPAHVEKQKPVTEYVCMRTVDQVEIANTKNKTYFGWAQFPVRDLEYTKRVGSQVRVY